MSEVEQTGTTRSCAGLDTFNVTAATLVFGSSNSTRS